MKVCFITFGCRLNRAEALQEEAIARAKGWEITDDHATADAFVVRGCSVTRRAQRDCEKTIAHLRHKHPLARVIVGGCLRDKSPANPFSVPPRDALPVPTRTARAFLKVQDGCSASCAFCIVPRFRGPSVSVPFDKALDGAKRFLDAGYHEIVVTGCNLALYRAEQKRLPDLLAALADLSPECRIRLGSLEPGPCARETIDVMIERRNVCRFLHLPVQSGSAPVLVSMRRPYTLKTVEEILDRVKDLDFGLGCDLMTGFPGEREIDFYATVALLRNNPFSKAHVFPFSVRPGTAAEKMPDRVPRDVRHSRARELEKIADESRRLFARRFIGREVEVLIEDEARQAGWTSEYLWFEGATPDAPRVPRKHLARFTVKTARDHTLSGVAVSGET